MIVFLTGYMGSGKTTLGKKLARKLEYGFIDLDKAIEDRAGMTIADYFSHSGEAAFRQLERSVLLETVYPENCVVATGGGLPCFFDNMDCMNAMGTTIYLRVPPGMLASRVLNGKQERPILKNLQGEELLTFIREKLTEREPFYQKAKLIIDAAHPDPDETAKLIRNQLR
jgi:shikimate kinase